MQNRAEAVNDLAGVKKSYSCDKLYFFKPPMKRGTFVVDFSYFIITAENMNSYTNKVNVGGHPKMNGGRKTTQMKRGISINNKKHTPFQWFNLNQEWYLPIL